MKNQRGFTLIELVVVIVILGILAAVAVPKFVDMKADALTASKAGMSGNVKSAHSILVAKKAVAGNTPIYPTITELVAGIDGEGITAVATGVQVTINATTYIAPTYTDSTCVTPTTAVADTVKCVKQIP